MTFALFTCPRRLSISSRSFLSGIERAAFWYFSNTRRSRLKNKTWRFYFEAFNQKDLTLNENDLGRIILSYTWIAYWKFYKKQQTHTVTFVVPLLWTVLVVQVPLFSVSQMRQSHSGVFSSPAEQQTSQKWSAATNTHRGLDMVYTTLLNKSSNISKTLQTLA